MVQLTLGCCTQCRAQPAPGSCGGSADRPHCDPAARAGLGTLCWDGRAPRWGTRKCPPGTSAVPVQLSSLDGVWEREISFSRNLLLLFGLNFPLLNFVSLPAVTPCRAMWQHSNRYLKCYRVSQLVRLKSIPYHDIIYFQYAQICQDTLGLKRDWPIAWEFSFRLRSEGCCASLPALPRVCPGAAGLAGLPHAPPVPIGPEPQLQELLRPSPISAKKTRSWVCTYCTHLSTASRLHNC